PLHAVSFPYTTLFRSSPPLAEEAAVSAAANRVGGLMTAPPAGNARAVQCLTQPKTLSGREAMRSSGTELTDHVSGFFPSEIEWSDRKRTRLNFSQGSI